MTPKEAAERLKQAKDGSSQEFFDAVTKVVNGLLKIPEFKQLPLVMASLIRQAECDEIELTRKGVFLTIRRMVDEENEYRKTLRK